VGHGFENRLGPVRLQLSGDTGRPRLVLNRRDRQSYRAPEGRNQRLGDLAVAAAPGLLSLIRVPLPLPLGLVRFGFRGAEPVRRMEARPRLCGPVNSRFESCS